MMDQTQTRAMDPFPLDLDAAEARPMILLRTIWPPRKRHMASSNLMWLISNSRHVRHTARRGKKFSWSTNFLHCDQTHCHDRLPLARAIDGALFMRRWELSLWRMLRKWFSLAIPRLGLRAMFEENEGLYTASWAWLLH